MSIWSSLSTGGKVLAAGGIAALFGLGLYIGPDTLGTGGEQVVPLSPSGEITEQVVSEPLAEPAEQPVASGDAVDDVTGDTVDTVESTLPEPAPQAVIKAPPPEFDIVRVDPDGSVLVAGRGEPNSSITVKVDGKIIGEVMADSSGQFVSLFAVKPSDTPRIISLSSSNGGDPVAAEQTVVISAFEPAVPVDETVAQLNELSVDETPGSETEQSDQLSTAEQDVVSGQSSQAETELANSDTVAPTVLLATEEGHFGSAISGWSPGNTERNCPGFNQL